MPRGRHRHSPPLHRLLPPSAIAGVSLVCAAGPWLFTETAVLRGLAAGAAVTAVLGAVVMRRWDSSAGKQVADLTRARASDEWRYEERVAELETDLDESRELRVKLEHKLRAKRTELAGLRNEHAALLRRYATAETERASALEGRRLLAIETTAPARALPAALTAASEEPEVSEEPEASEVVSPGSDADTDAVEAVEATVVQKSPEVFSPAGSSLFLRAYAALNRISNIAPEPDGSAPSDPVKSDPVKTESVQAGSAEAEASASDGAAAEEGEAEGKPEAVGGHERAAAETKPSQSSSPQDLSQDPSQEPSSKSPQSPDPADPEDPVDPQPSHPADHSHPAKPSAHSAPAEPSNLPAPAKPPKPVKPVKPSPSSGHFTVPTAVAVVPAAPVRRPSVEGGFDFFGTQQEPSATALEAVQNEDLADVVGQEALALHKAEAEAGFKPADEDSRGVGQVIDLTVHDETERIDVAELRSAVS
ncbi:hypothetical protein [Streptomyces sp. NBC_00038]|uniref:hypothetical protein n=1 Tax=Streptomyces sp. NBC_00038 TaxID=2903615 RepID=UPI0022541EDC|nr:hypothetical protein [Streptomyces sp. NBC_00038]MCX5559614.1 hypothetical protein [Streptomyces sp. NBC_00038]